MAASTAPTDTPVKHFWIVAPERDVSTAAPAARVWGLTAVERLERALSRAGAGQVQVLESGDAIQAPTTGGLLLVRGDYCFDERLIAGLIEGPARVLEDTTGEGQAVAARLDEPAGPETLIAAVACLRGGPGAEMGAGLSGIARVATLDVAPAYNKTLRKHDPPFLIRAEPSRVREIENRIFSASYKGITDLVTKWVFPVPARSVTRLLAARGVRPNSVTAVSYVLTVLAGWLFMEGHFALGLAAAWGMTFLDTVDGKLARVTLTSSPIGNVLDHGLDLVHPPFWWAAYAYGLAPAGEGLGQFEWMMWVIVVGYVVGRLLEGIFLLAFKQEIFCWRPFDAFFRTIIARRNPNLLLLTAGILIGQPAQGYLAVAIWTGICIAVPVIRIAQAFAVQASGVPIHSWYDAQLDDETQARARE